jgi:hypothetical protein
MNDRELDDALDDLKAARGRMNNATWDFFRHHDQIKYGPQNMAPPRSTQVGGSHYASMAIQPFEYIHANGIGFAEGCVIKYVSRWRAKGGIEDLRKAKHFLDLLIESESKNG